MTECRSCTPGMYCQTEGLTEPTGNCTIGHFCSGGAINQAPLSLSYGDTCPAGYYCPAGTGQPIACPLGTFSPTTGRGILSDCLDCTPGMYCDTQGRTNYTGPCTEGYFCSGKASDPAPTDGTTGNICPTGAYCPTGSPSPIPCNDGWYMNHTGAALCDVCPPRFYCVNKNYTNPCPVGKYCPANTGFNWQSCPQGTYGPNEGLMVSSECTQCDGGMFCNSPGQSNVTGPCTEGFYCQFGVNTASPNNNNTGFGGVCPSGTYCPTGTKEPIGCPAGTYNDIVQQRSCRLCQAGYYCLANSTTYLNTPCPRGAYCPTGTGAPYQYECPPGTYNNRTTADNAYDCLPCPPGKYCNGAGRAEPSGDCAPGWYCSRGAFSNKPVPKVNITDAFSVNNGSCPIYSLNDTGGVCTPGNYCPEGSEAELPCPPGQYCQNYALAAPSGPCKVGFFCNGSSIVQDPIQCISGSYCPEGTPVQVKCPPGTFSGRIGNHNISDCEPCTAGYYCDGYGLSAPIGPCDAGYFCPGGQDKRRPLNLACSPGHFCLTGSWNETGCPSGTYQAHWGRSFCEACPVGFYCKSIGDYEILDSNVTGTGNFSGRFRSFRGVSVPSICPPGSVCPSGTKYEREYTCLPGTYSNKTGLSNETLCTKCDPGMYCNGNGITEPSGQCTARYFCTLGAATSTPTDGITGNICQPGKYCETGSITGENCPKGTFSNKTGLGNSSECTLCTPGHYCAQTGLTEPNGLCWAGFFCSEASPEPAPISKSYGDVCKPGHYCPNGTDISKPCPPGTYQDKEGLQDISDCLKCPEGKYCSSFGKTNYTDVCSRGYYCIRGANNSSPTDAVTGDICPEGNYCEEGSISPTPCQNGTFMNHTGAWKCYTCPAGYSCTNRDRADICLAGYYCPEGTGADLRPCPTGTFGNTTGLTQGSECTLCIGGYHCSIAGSNIPNGQCSPGYYCERGVDTPTPANDTAHKGIGDKCPTGHYCPIGSSQPLPCAPGTYNNVIGKAVCEPCPAGYYCTENTTNPFDFACPTGHYCPQGTKYDVEFKCPAGTYNDLTTRQAENACKLCSPGKYCGAQGLEIPSGNCSAGWYCVGGSWSSKPTAEGNVSMPENTCTCPAFNSTGSKCLPGTYCPSGSSAPIKCEAGSYCDQPELALPAGLCQAGFYCPLGQIVKNPSLFICLPGHYCPEGSLIPIACPNGTFTNTSGNTELVNCLPCTPGYYCSGTRLTKETNPCDDGFYCPGNMTTASPAEYICPRGFRCPQGSSAPIQCERGYYQATEGKPTCDPCPTGKYCDPHELGNVTGIIYPVDCPAGYYCPLRTEFAKQNPCMPGTWSNITQLTQQSECYDCLPGKYCFLPGKTEPTNECLAGYYCSRKANESSPEDGATGDICPMGYYCPIGSHTGVKCPIGSYGNTTGLRSPTECPRCDPGWYCPTTGLIAPHAKCTAGHYCKLGALASNPVNETWGYSCPVGHYCPEGIPTPTPCPRGSYQPIEGKAVSGDCLPCEPGKYCLIPGQPNVTGSCLAGFYCTIGALESNPTDNVTGNICPIGHYCPIGSSKPLPCNNGTFMNHTGAPECYECPEGFYCTNRDRADPCPQGFYCPRGTGTGFIPCPIGKKLYLVLSNSNSSFILGTFGAAPQLSKESDCSFCRGGYFCDVLGLPAPTGGCSSGFYCTQRVNITNPQPGVPHTGIGGKCSAGNECPENSTFPSPCPPGKYAPNEGLASCIECPAGYYCENSTVVPIICPTGYICPAGTEFASQNACPEGTFNNDTGASNITSCKPCLPGQYCSGTANTIPDGDCDEGFFCTGGSFNKRPFDLGSLSGNGSLSSLVSNNTCFPLWSCTCPAFHMTTGGICPPGYYCPTSSMKPLPCPGGTYCEHPGLSEPTGNCSAGFYCNHTSSIPDQHICPMGHYCPIGSPHPVPCPSGTFANNTKNSQVSDCLNCTAGNYCEGDGNEEPDGPCSPGFYCPSGQDTPTPSNFKCWKGHYCPVGTAVPEVCRNGTYQHDEGRENCDICPPGYYCDPTPGQAVIDPAPCPIGHYCPIGTGLNTSFPCPPGTFAPVTNYQSEENCTACTAGYYCETPGLSSPTGQCYAGYYCTGGAKVSAPQNDNVDPAQTVLGIFTGNDACPQGHYCMNGTSYPVPCPAGTYSLNEGVMKVERCTLCPPGKYCSSKGFIDPAGPPNCAPGYVCLFGSKTSKPNNGTDGFICNPGFYCPAGSSFERGCPIGTFNDKFGQPNCTECLAGLMCDKTNMTTPVPCKEGHYCPAGTPPQPCPEATFNNKTGLKASTECTWCAVGHYCQGVGNIIPSGECEAGQYCQGGAKDRVPITSNALFPNNGPCKPGHYCPQGTSYQVPCPIGTLRNTTLGKAIQDCSNCTPGYYCAKDGLDAPTGKCQRGYYCPGEQTSVPNPNHLKCPPGHFCIEGSAVPESCPAGESQPDEGQWACVPCPAGYYCKSNTNPNPEPCTPFSYCPLGSSVPTQCPNGTHTTNDTYKLQKIEECLPCPAGKYCRGGYISGDCSAGFFCLSGSDEFTPVGNPPSADPINNPCAPNTVCAGPCPGGSYCPEGTTDPVPCPEHTLHNGVGARHVNDCLPCPAGYWCHAGDANPTPCPRGNYCPEGLGPIKCPRLHYRDVELGSNLTDCFPCPGGYWCNTTGISNYRVNPCPIGHYCEEASEPAFCPAGRMRPSPGAANYTDCPLCRAGFFCPNDTANTRGIPCQETFECPSGSALPFECRPGHYCGPVTGVSPICPAGYYCPNATGSAAYPCPWPYYCPEGSNMTLVCPLGYMARNVSGLRTMLNQSCSVCPAGTYGNHSQRAFCQICPAGFYCPEQTGNGNDNPCPKGHYCPRGSGDKKPCDKGYYGKFDRAEKAEDCKKCPLNTYNDQVGKDACFPCGSSSSAKEGAVLCQCKGLYRYFRPSDGWCICQGGYHYFDEADQQLVDSDGDTDCQRIVRDRCPSNYIRLSNTGLCKDPTTYDCSGPCYGSNGKLAESGSCVCEKYRSSQSICDANCVKNSMPRTTLRFSSDGTAKVTAKDPSTGASVKLIVKKIFAPRANQINTEKKMQVCNAWPDRLACVIYTKSVELINSLNKPLNSYTSAATRRRLLQTQTNGLSDGTSEIPNPLVCLEVEEMIIFRVYVNTNDRKKSNYPVYVKSHLWNTNAEFDYGDFRQLEYYITKTNVTYNSFAFVFSEAGTYVFADAQDLTREMVVTVKKIGSSCPTDQARVQSASPQNLVQSGIKKNEDVNEAPDWGLIIGLICFFAACVLMLVIAVIVWRPKNAGIYPLKHWKPKYRSLGAPPPVPMYVRFDEDHWPEQTKSVAQRTSGDGAEEDGSGIAWKKEEELENFNVRVLFDKLEDQNLHLAAQLARHQQDLQSFYDKINDQNETLKNMLNNLDMERLEELEKQRKENADRSAADGSEVFDKMNEGGPIVVDVHGKSSDIHKHYKLTGGLGREQELMLALQMLLDKLNNGHIPISKEMIDAARRGEHTTLSGESTVVQKGRIEIKGGNDMLRRQNAERLQLERDLNQEEIRAMESLLRELNEKAQSDISKLSDKFSDKMQVDMTEAEIAALLNVHDASLADMMCKQAGEREKQCSALRRKLAERRKNQVDSLRQKHGDEADKAGIPRPVEPLDNSLIHVKLHESLLQETILEDDAGVANASLEADNNATEKLREKMSEFFKDHIELARNNGSLSPEEADVILKKQAEQEKAMEEDIAARRVKQEQALHARLSARRQKQLESLREEQEREKREISSQLLQEGKHEELEALMTEIEKRHEHERNTLEAEIEAVEAEHKRQLGKSLNEEHLGSIRELHDNLLENAKMDSLDQQKLLDAFRSDILAAEDEMARARELQFIDLKAKLSARKARKLDEADRQNEELAAQRFIDEQARQMKTPVIENANDSTFTAPSVSSVPESGEERSLKKRHDTAKMEMKQRHEQEAEQLLKKIDADSKGEESKLHQKQREEKEQLLKEKRNKHAAEISARKGMSSEELAAVSFEN